MKKLWNTSMIYLILALAGGVFYREFSICSYPPSGAWHVPLSSDYPFCQPEAGTFT